MAIGSFLPGNEIAPAKTVHLGGHLHGNRILVPILRRQRVELEDQFNVALTLARAAAGEILLEDPDPAADSASFTLDETSTQATVEQALEWGTDSPSHTEGSRVDSILSARRIETRLCEIIREEAIDTLVLPRSRGEGVLGHRRLQRLATSVPCNVITVGGTGGYRAFASLLLPVSNGPHAGVATDLAAAICERTGAYVDVLHVLNPDADEATRQAANERTQTAVDRIDNPEKATTWLLESRDPARTIIEQSSYYGLTVIGAPTTGRLHRFVYGSTSQLINDEAESVVLAARTPMVDR